MIRKTTAIIFILLANIILLASAVIPHHHHHGEQDCLNIFHIHQTEHDSTKYPADCTHGKENTDVNCILKQLVIVPANQGRIEPVVLYLENFTDCFILQAGNLNELQSAELFRKNPYPKDVPIFQSFLDYTQGLRAPPAV